MKSGTFAVIGIILGVLLCVIGYHTIASSITFMNFFIPTFSNEPYQTQSIAPVLAMFGTGVIASLLGVVGLFLERHDKIFAAIEYIICGIFLAIGGMFIFGGIPAIFFFIAAYYSYKDDLEEKNKLIEKSLLVQCPYCKSSIPNDATKCRFCGEWVINERGDKIE